MREYRGKGTSVSTEKRSQHIVLQVVLFSQVHSIGIYGKEDGVKVQSI